MKRISLQIEVYYSLKIEMPPNEPKKISKQEAKLPRENIDFQANQPKAISSGQRKQNTLSKTKHYSKLKTR